jgi:hypothetical protein
MVIPGFIVGAVFGAAQYFLARKVFIAKAKAVWSALYITQLLILSLGLLILVFFVWNEALLAVGVGIVAASMALAVIFNLLKR